MQGSQANHAACLIEVLVWRAHSHACASAAATSWAGADRVWLLARLIDGLLVRLLHAASEGMGGGHCHGKQVMLALRSTLGDGPLRLEVMRHVGRALKWKHARKPQELHRLHADVPLVAERAAIVRGTRPPTARAVLMLTASLQAVAASALRAILRSGSEVNALQPRSAHDEVLAGLLSSHDDGALALLLSDGDAGAARAASGVNPAAAAAVARRLAAEPASQRPGGGEPVKVKPPPPREAAPSDAAQPQQRQTTVGAGPPPVWLEELQALRVERAQLRVQNEKLQTIVDGMLQPYGNLQPWVEWWSTL